MPIHVTTTTVGFLSVNAYLAEDEETSEAILIDPGDRPDRILAVLQAKGITPESKRLKSIWITHVHFDHIASAEAVADRYDCPIYVSEADLLGAKEAPAYGKMMAESYESFFRVSGKRAVFVDFETTYSVGNTSFTLLSVPGHSKESICLYFEKEKILFDGDTLFLGAIGREDMFVNDQGGQKGTLLNNIRRKLLVMPRDTKVYPGHGLPTTIGAEQHFLRDIFGTNKGLQ